MLEKRALFTPEATRVAKILFLLIAVYISVYCALSFSGAYEDNYGTMARMGNPCFCISDEDQWQPRGMAYVITTDAGEASARISALAYFFLPLIRFDQTYWHVTKKIVIGA